MASKNNQNLNQGIAAPTPIKPPTGPTVSASGSGRSQDAASTGPAQAADANASYNWTFNPSDGNWYTPGGQVVPYSALDATQKQQSLSWQSQSQLANGTAASTAAADLAEKIREFNITTQRDVAKQNATEVDSLQKLLLGLTGPKDPYAYTFFSRGLTPPQGYKPAGVPMTDAQTQAWLSQNPGKTAADLQTALTGGGQAPAWAQNGGVLGNMPVSMATSNPSVNPQTMPTQTQPAPTKTPVQPTATPPQGQVTQGVQNYMATPALLANPAAGNPTAPVPSMALGGTVPTPSAGGVSKGMSTPMHPVYNMSTPSMAQGGEVPGDPGTPQLAVLHGGEHVTPAPDTPNTPPQPQGQSQSLMDTPGLHPAIAALVDAVSGLLQNPDFAPFVAGTLHSTQATPGGIPSRALGGAIPAPSASTGGAASAPAQSGAAPSNPSPTDIATYQDTGRWPTATPAPAPSAGASGSGAKGASAGVGTGLQQAAPQAPISGTPQGGAQGVTYNTGLGAPKDQPLMPLGQMDPYSAALYDTMGKLHPYSAQQEAQMGPSGTAAVGSYVSKVEGMDINDYTNLVNRLKPIGAAPSASTETATEGFTFG